MDNGKLTPLQVFETAYQVGKEICDQRIDELSHHEPYTLVEYDDIPLNCEISASGDDGIITYMAELLKVRRTELFQKKELIDKGFREGWNWEAKYHDVY